MNWLILLLGVLANASASVLVKMAMIPPRKVPSLFDPMSLITNGPFLLGLLLYAVTFLLYAAALTRLPLNITHPVLTSGSIAIVAILSILIFREAFYWTTGAGIFLVIAGVVLLTMRIG